MKKLMQSTIMTHLMVGLLVAYGRLFLATCRVKVITPIPPEMTKGPVVIALWHQQLVATTLAHSPNPAPLVGLMSASRDGQLMHKVGKAFGVEAAVGSSHRQAISAALTLVKKAKGGKRSLFLTPDGPRGPARQAKAGAVAIAAMAGLPVVPCAAAYSHYKMFQSWDRFLLPLPFSAVFLAYGPAREDMTPEELTQSLQQLSQQTALAAGMDKTSQMA